ncbi:acyltransferase family protein [Streptomyces violaceusniger]|uniref:Acyltransferase 3 n=1 Tax=Streptomyces violaceusniger (strain Tu 4113) TaxID=653045 RepID=G2PGF9_STRV4|nr:acyltransferase family protein [Streptomyces violaceusniger]AEM85538.1 acyltransferase 3 [Streptomyces violaceusniger Tu 4113]
MTHTPTAARPQRDTAPGHRVTGLAQRLCGHHVSRSGGRTPKAALRRDIQGLRGLAVTLVVLAHAGVPYAPGGYAGVDVFFVISGFLITAGLLKEAEHTGSLSLRRFYARRAVRILPLATLVALVTMAGCRLFASKIRYTEFMHDALAGALYVMNIDLAVSGADYLNEDTAPSPFQHFWSLSVEEQFYLLWPVLLLASWKLIRRPALRALPLGALCLVSYVQGVQVAETSPSWAYFGPHTRLWELGAGSLLAFGAGAPARLPRGVSAAGTWLGLSGIAASAVLYDDDTPFPGHFALLPVLGAALVIAGGCRTSPSAASRLLAVRPAAWVGDLSYGWYLWHWPLLMIGPTALGRPAGTWLNLALCAVALLLARVSLHLVENPVRFRGPLRRKPTAAVAFGLCLSATVVSAALVAASFPPPISSAVRAPGLNEALTTAQDPRYRLTGLIATAATGLPRNLTPPLTDIKKKRSAVYRDGCHVNYTATRSPDCVYGDRTSDKVVVLYGDSHAAQWFPALEKLSRRYGWKLVSLTKSSCKTADITIVNGHRPYEACDTWRKEALKRIERLHPMLVVASSSEAGTSVRPLRDPLREWAAGYERVYRQLARAADHVAVLLDNPWPKDDPVECAASRPLRLRGCEPDQRDAVKDPTRREANRQGARRAGAAVVDPKPWLCPRSGGCPVAVGDTFVYRDESHLAETYVEALAPVLRQELRKPGLTGD